MADPLSLAPPQQAQQPQGIPVDNNVPVDTPTQPISLDSNTNAYMLDPQAIASRAFKASYGLQGTPAAQTQGTIASAISAGQEPDIRDQTAATLNQDVSNQKVNAAASLANKPGPITDEDMAWLHGTPAFNTFYDPKTVFETNYANTYVSQLDQFSAVAGNQNAWTILKQFPGTDTDPFGAVQTFGTKGLAWHEFILNRLQNTQSKINNQSNVGFAADFLKMAFPILNPYYELKMRSNVPGVSFFDGLLGSNLEDQRNALINMPFAKGAATFDTIMDKLDRDNPQAAAAFAASMLGQSSSDKILNNINTIGNLSDVPSVLKMGMVAYKGASILNQARRAVATAAISNAVSPDVTKANILAAVGANREAAISEAAEKVANIIKGSTTPTQDALDALPRFMRSDISNITGDPGDLTPTQVNALTEQYKASESKILTALTETLRPTRVPLENATPDVMRSIAESTFNRYPGMKNAIIRFSDPDLEPVSNTYHVTAWIGKNAGEFFNTEDEAIQYARYHGLAVRYNPDQLGNLEARIADLKDQIANRVSGTPEAISMGDEGAIAEPSRFGPEKQLADLEKQYAEAKSAKTGATIGQQGSGYYIEVTKPLNETSRIVRDFIYNPERASSTNPESWTSKVPFLDYARTPEDTMSPEARGMRKAAIYPQSKLLEIAHDEWKYISKGSNKLFNKEQAGNFHKALVYAQDAIDPDTGLRGYYFDTPRQLQDWYLRTLGKAPSFEEQQAYFAVKRWSEYDLMLREAALYRNKSRLGTETHQIISKDASGNEVRSDKFDGVTRDRFPGGDGNILVMGDGVQDSKLRSLSRMTVKEKNEFDKMVKDGTYKVIEPYDADQLPMKGFVPDGDKMVDYILAKNVETSPLSWEQLPQRGGGHLVYDYENYVKQAKTEREKVDGTSRVRYKGDTTVAGIPYRSMGEDIADKLNEVRTLYKGGKFDEAEALTTKHLPFTWEDLSGKFKDGTFDLDEPFMNVPRNRSILDMPNNGLEGRAIGKGVFTDDTKTGLARNFQVQYTGKRDAEEFNTVVNTGTQSNPVYAFRPAEKIDPVEVLNRALGSIVHSTFMDDYKTSAVESLLREATPYFRNSFATPSQVASSPFNIYKLMDRDSFRTGTPPEVINRLLSNKFKIEQLVGTPSQMDTFLHSIAQSLADSIAEKGGTKLADKLIPSWLISATRDPFAFIRGVTFDAYLGFGYIPQLFIQMTYFLNAFAVTPRYATTGSFAMYLHFLSRVNSNPEILAHLDSLAVKLGSVMPGMPKWRPGEWREAMEALDRTGFENVGKEFGPLATLKYAKPVSNMGQTFLNWGRKPFETGVRAARIGAWYTAFKEFRDVHPTGAINNGDLQKILDRAALLHGNMDHSSNSALNSGFLSLPMQFHVYTLRQAELFWGKRLGNTVGERMAARARMLAINSALFGVPMSFGISGLPVGDYLRREMLDNGFFGATKPYDVDQAQQSGKPSDWIEHMLMEGMPATLLTLATGNNYNFGPRYSSKGFDTISDALNGDSNFLQTFAGASGSFTMNTFKNGAGLANVAGAIIRGDTKQFPLMPDDILDLGNEIQTIGKGRQLVTALRTGQLLTKNSSFVSNVDKVNAFFMTLAGLSPQEQQDAYSEMENLKAQKNREEGVIKIFSREWDRGIVAAANNDPEQAKKYFARAIGAASIGNLPDDKVAMAIARATKGRESLINSIAWERYVQNPPKGMEDAYQKVYSDIKKTLESRGQ